MILKTEVKNYPNSTSMRKRSNFYVHELQSMRLVRITCILTLTLNALFLRLHSLFFSETRWPVPYYLTMQTASWWRRYVQQKLLLLETTVRAAEESHQGEISSHTSCFFKEVPKPCSKEIFNYSVFHVFPAAVRLPCTPASPLTLASI